MVAVSLLDQLAPSDQQAVRQIMRRRRYRRGEVICRAGDLGDTLHLVMKGRVAVRLHSRDGCEIITELLGPGGMFGELALLGSTPRRAATVSALEPVETFTLQLHEFTEIRRLHPTVNDVVIAALHAQVERVSNLLIDALHLPADDRVLRRLAELAVVYDEGAVPIIIPLTQDEIASMAGTTRPTANRVLRRLVEQGVVELGRGRTIVHDVARIGAPLR